MASVSIDSAKRARKTKHQPVVVYADELDFKTNCFLNTVYSNKKGFKSVKVFTSEENPNPLRIQFQNVPGGIPQKFGVDTNQHGKTILTFAIPCEKEYSALLKFQEDAKEYAKAHKEEWWNYPVSDNQVEDNFASIVSARKEKIEGNGFWPGNMKVHIPLDDEGEVKNCRVLNEDGNAISIHELPGRKWDSVMVEISGIYFQNRYNWGFGPKTLRLLQVAEDEDGAFVAADVDYLDILLAKKERPTEATSESQTSTNDEGSNNDDGNKKKRKRKDAV